MDLTEEIATLVHASVDPIKRETFAQTEILKRVETNVIKTNGRVTDLERWRIASEAESQTRKEIAAAASSNYRGPIVSGLVVGMILVIVQIVLHTM